MAVRAATRLQQERPRRGAPAETRDRLVAAAADLFNRVGYHGTDSNRIASHAGYAAGTFYKHFADKREILLAAYEAWVTREWAEILAELDRDAASDELAERIVALVLRHHVRWRGLRDSLRGLVATDAGARRFYRQQRSRQIEMLRARRARAGVTPRAAAEDAVLLFTLERVCDAIAGGELRDLRVDRDGVLAVLHRIVRDAIALRPVTSPRSPGGR
jgi:AcrR family transcriptional regulator